jgi:hypothetical protein
VSSPVPFPEQSDLQEDLERLRRSNQRRLTDFAGQGVQVNIPPAPGAMVELLVERLVGPQGSPAWLEFFHAYEVKIREALDGVDSQVARARLMAPGQLPNGQTPMLRP